MILALHITATGAPDYQSEPTASHQPKPVRIETEFYSLDLQKIGAMNAVIRPQGWRVPDQCGVSQVVAERFGVDLKNPLAMITGKGGWVDAAGFILCHDFKRLDYLIRIWRSLLNGKPDWTRPRLQTIDTATAAMPVLSLPDTGKLFPDMTVLPNLKQATQGICGEAIGGLAGVMALYHKLRANGVLERVAA